MLSMTVDDQAAMQAWVAHLDELGVGYGPPTSGHSGVHVEVMGPGGLRLRLHTSDPVDADDA